MHEEMKIVYINFKQISYRLDRLSEGNRCGQNGLGFSLLLCIYRVLSHFALTNLRLRDRCYYESSSFFFVAFTRQLGLPGQAG